MLNDRYEHPCPDIEYIVECVIGPGVEESLTEEFDFKCNCENATCDSSDCSCVDVFCVNYRGRLLCDEKLFGNANVFECGTNCSCSCLCSNSVTQKGPLPYLKIVEYGIKGYGVISTVSVRKGTFICEYVGEVIGKEVAELRKPIGNYIVTIREHCTNNIIETYIDAKTKGNIGRYINHSCDPNCVLVPVRTGKLLPKAGIFASKNISAGEEITYNYNPGSSVFSKTLCLCFSNNCKNFLPSGV